MLRFLARRVALTIPVLLGVATLVFSLIHLIPGDPAQAMLGESASPQDVAELRLRLGSIGRSPSSTAASCRVSSAATLDDPFARISL